MRQSSRMFWMVGLLAPCAAAMGAAPSPFTMGKGVPADVYLYIHCVDNPEQEYLNQHWDRVGKAFVESGVVEEVHKLIASSLDEDARGKFEAFWKRADELVHEFDWQAKVHEFVYTARMGFPWPEYLFLLRCDPEAADKNASVLATILKEIAQAVGNEDNKVMCTSAKVHGATVWTLGMDESPDSPMPLARRIYVRVAHRGELVAIALDRELLSDSLALLAGEADKPGLTQSARYRRAMSSLPPAEDMCSFLDLSALFGGFRAIMETDLDEHGRDEEAKKILDALGKGVNELAVIDYVASTVRTDGYRQLSNTVTQLSPDAEQSRLYKAICRQEPIKRFDRHIPKEATGYSVWAGINWDALYDAVLDFIGTEVPEGKDLLTRWDAVQEEIGFRPKRDVLSWLDGPIISATIPAAVPGPFRSEDSVLLIQVRDEKKAAEKVKAGLDKLNDLLRSVQQPLASQPAEVSGADGFRTVTHPMLAMFLQPVYGVADGYLIIGTSPQAVDACLATARGERPSVVENERVVSEGLIPKGPVYSASFADMTKLGQNIAQMLGMMGMVSAMIPQQPELKPVKSLIGIAGRLAPVAMKLDFFVSQSAVCTFDGKAWHVRQVTNYSPPKPEDSGRQGVVNE